MPTPRPVHFEIYAADLARAQKFYGDIFGWTFNTWKGEGFDYVLVMTGDKTTPGINGGLLKRAGAEPVDGQAVNAAVLTMEVDDIDAYITKIEAAGGKVALAKMNMGGVGFMAYYKDTEGNVFGLMQPEKKM